MGNSDSNYKSELYLFVIDTDKYAGNFERQMCAYITGQIGDCGVGEENAEIARREIPDVVAQLEDLIEQVPDEHGCHRPVSIFQTPGWFNHGMGGHFRNGQEECALTHYKKEVEEYYKKVPESYVENLREKIREECQQRIDEANTLTEVPKHPAYNSVIIYFHKAPERNLIEIMQERARNIASRGVGLIGFEEKVTIEGFRLLKKYVNYEEISLSSGIH